MKEINDAKKIKGRKRAYDYKKIEDLMDQGLSPVKIASRLHTSSVQSIRHSMERIKNERKIAENAERKHKLEIQKEEKRKDEIRIKYDSVNKAGLLQIAVDDETMDALVRLLPRSRTYADGLIRFIINKGNGEIIIKNSASPSEIRKFLADLGFYADTCNIRHNIDVLKMRVVPDDLREDIDWGKWVDGIIQIYSSDDVEQHTQEIVYGYVVKGYIDYTSMNSVSISRYVNSEIAVKDVQIRLKEAGIHAHLHYNPLWAMLSNDYVLVNCSNDYMEVIKRDKAERLNDIALEGVAVTFRDKRISWRIQNYLYHDVGDMQSYLLDYKNSEQPRKDLLDYIVKEIGLSRIPIAGNEKILSECGKYVDKDLQDLLHIYNKDFPERGS